MTLDCSSFLFMGLVLTVMTQAGLWFMDTLLHPTLDFLCTWLIMETSIASDTHSPRWLIQTCRTDEADLTLLVSLLTR